MYALVMALMLCVCGADISLRPRIAYGQDPLEEIRETIPVICETPPVEQTNSGYVLSGKAKAGVNQLISKLVDLNVEGAGSYHTEHSSGVLQQDLAKALANSNECKLTAFKILEEDIIRRKLLVPSPVATPSPGSCVTNKYASSATATNGAFYLRFGFSGYLQPA